VEFGGKLFAYFSVIENVCELPPGARSRGVEVPIICLHKAEVTERLRLVHGGLTHPARPTGVESLSSGGLVAIPAMILSGFFSKSVIDRLLELMNGTMDRLIDGALLMRHHDRLIAIPARLDHAALVVTAGLVTDRIAEVYIDPPDTIAVPAQRCTHLSLHAIGQLFAAVDVRVSPDLDQHHRLRWFIAWITA
jgi:hypothetical protein